MNRFLRNFRASSLSGVGWYYWSAGWVLGGSLPALCSIWSHNTIGQHETWLPCTHASRVSASSGCWSGCAGVKCFPENHLEGSAQHWGSCPRRQGKNRPSPGQAGFFLMSDYDPEALKLILRPCALTGLQVTLAPTRLPQCSQSIWHKIHSRYLRGVLLFSNKIETFLQLSMIHSACWGTHAIGSSSLV